ncbi:MAG: Gfo/Idh/MocA family oxidoreductase [Clostridia bacterium]|nr:Gfo/Idh/MocA family oxidoreductase [Clostridia bacterium]
MDKVRFAVVGVHSIAKHHISGINKLPQAELIAVCDIHEEYAKARAKENGLDKYYLDYDQMLADGGFDCVVICTPDQVHAEQAIKALEAGYHVLCEKPLAMKMEDCKAIVEAAKKSNKKFMVGQVCRKTPAFIAAKHLVEKGEIGQLFFVESEYAHNYDIIEDIDGWRRDPVNLRYPIVGGGCHAMDLLRWIAGDPTEVFCYANHLALPHWPVDDCYIAVLKYPNDVIGKVMTSIGCHRPYTMRTMLYGTKGTIEVDNTSPTLKLYRDITYPRAGGKPSTKYLPTELPVEINSHNMTAEIEDMCNVILRNDPTECDVIQGANTVAVCHAAIKSAAEGKPCAPEYFC